ncbi:MULTISPECIES: glutamate racemase [unclassified Helicobacter]|uniref:glutamate racemase n=1 Tax=unclassified Helicobacter TaxID=2593540 RepID=UPI0009ED60D5|nr:MULTISPECIES: glutamate racemase [unclassified Helicobacter]
MKRAHAKKNFDALDSVRESKDAQKAKKGARQIPESKNALESKSAPKSLKLGIFDSGVGGLSVAKSVLESRIFSEVVYYGDTARVPYGVKDAQTIIRFSLEALDFFKEQRVDMLIVACNTASAYALDALKNSAPFPVIGVVEPGVLARINACKNKESTTLILGTKATITSGVYQHLLKEAGFSRLCAVPTGLLVPIVEEGLYKSHSGAKILRASLEHYLAPFLRCIELDNRAPDTIILGCTHFPFIAKEIGEFFGEKSILIHSGDAIVEYLESTHALQTSRFGQTSIEFFASSDVEGLKARAALWLEM